MLSSGVSLCLTLSPSLVRPEFLSRADKANKLVLVCVC